ncbi:hypothetical protein AKJ16_DCAP06408 [Drosera capensis]
MGKADERYKWEADDLLVLETGGVGFPVLVDMERFVCHAGAEYVVCLVVLKIFLGVLLEFSSGSLMLKQVLSIEPEEPRVPCIYYKLLRLLCTARKRILSKLEEIIRERRSKELSIVKPRDSSYLKSKI